MSSGLNNQEKRSTFVKETSANTSNIATTAKNEGLRSTSSSPAPVFYTPPLLPRKELPATSQQQDQQEQSKDFRLVPDTTQTLGGLKLSMSGESSKPESGAANEASIKPTADTSSSTGAAAGVASTVAAANIAPAKQRPSTPTVNTAIAKPESNNAAEPGTARSIPPTPTTAVGDMLHLRCLVTMKEAGIIIGKGGKNIADVRECSGARVMISELVQGAYERIITISGNLNIVAKAFALLSAKVLEEQQLNSAMSGNGLPNNNDGTHTVRLLIAHNRMGGIIGRGGAKIKEIQDVSGVRLNASEEMLPNSTERIIMIRGVPEMIHLAIFHIGTVILEGGDRFADRATIHYKPHAKYYTNNGGNQFGNHHHTHHLHQPLSAAGTPHPSLNPALTLQPVPTSSGGPLSPHPGGQQHFAPPLPAPHTRPAYANANNTNNSNGGRIGGGVGAGGAVHPPVIPPGHEQQQIFIPNDMVGCIIGKAGARINEIRTNSGCHIRVAESGNMQGERLITIIGTPEGCQRALYMLYHRLEEEKKRTTERAATAAATATSTTTSTSAPANT